MLVMKRSDTFCVVNCVQLDNLERYEYFFQMDDPETVLLIDRWKDQEALDIHHKSEMMNEIAVLREKFKLRLRVERYIDV